MINYSTITQQRDLVTKELEQMVNNSNLGSFSQPIARTLFGLNHRLTPLPVPMNKDQRGIVLMTRPRLNLSDENIRMDRRLAWLKTDNNKSVNHYIRCLLDPSLQDNYGITCPFVDPFQSFMPIMTNTLESLTNWKDITASTYQYPDGFYRESQSFYDGPSLDYTLYDISGSWKNVLGNIVTKIAAVWIHYGFFVFEDRLVPYPDYWWNFEIDYNTRIFKLTLDATKTYVTQMWSTIAYPLNAPTGASANFEANNPFNTSNNQVNINWRAHGTETIDNLLVEEFNAIVCQRNPRMEDKYREQYMHRLEPSELNFFNNWGYPHIDLNDNMRLSWWVFKEHYETAFLGRD